MSWCPFVIYFLWHQICVGLANMGWCPFIVYRLWHQVVGPNKYGLMSICYLLFMAPSLFGPSKHGLMPICRLLFVAPSYRAQQIWVDAHLWFAVCGTKNEPRRGRISPHLLPTVFGRQASFFVKFNYKIGFLNFLITLWSSEPSIYGLMPVCHLLFVAAPLLIMWA